MSNLNERIISASQYDILKLNMESGNRVAFYVNLFKFTGSDAALLMAQISSGSGLIGGLAWAVNLDIQRHFPNLYPPGGIVAFSVEIANNDYNLIRPVDGNPSIYSAPTEAQMLRGAFNIWDQKKLGDYWPGLTLFAKSELKDGNYRDALTHMAQGRTLLSSIIPAMREFTGELVDSRENYGKSIQECLDQNPYATTRTFTAFHREVTEVIAKDGKSVCIFNRAESLPVKIEDIKVNPMGDVTSASITQEIDGKYILDWQDINGTHRRDVYDQNETVTYLDKSDITIQTANGGTSRGIYDLNPNGSEQNKQIIQTSATGEIHARLKGTDIFTNFGHAAIDLDANTSATIFGEGNYFTSSGTGMWANLVGSDTHVNFMQSGNVVGLSGLRQSYTGANNTVWLNAGSDAVIGGNNNRVVMNGSGSYAEIYGSNTNVETSGTGQRIGLTGTHQHINASGSDVWLQGNSDGIIAGNNNWVVLQVAGNYAEIYGASTTVNALAAGQRIGLTGANQHVNASASDVWLHAGSDGVIGGNNNVVVGNGDATHAFIFGDNTSYRSQGQQNEVFMSGHHLTITGDHVAITLAPGSDATIFGVDNAYASDGKSTVNFVSESWRNVFSNPQNSTQTPPPPTFTNDLPQSPVQLNSIATLPPPTYSFEPGNSPFQPQTFQTAPPANYGFEFPVGHGLIAGDSPGVVAYAIPAWNLGTSTPLF